MDSKRRIEPDESLDALLDRVERGEEVVIERDGRRVARLVPAETANRGTARAALDRILARKRAPLGGDLKIKDIIHRGYRY
jgi:prevent-host-death family protein